MNTARKEAHNEVDALGGKVHAIISNLEDKVRADPGWRYHIHVDPSRTVTAVFWQSPLQVDLAKRYSDVLLHDNSYKHVNCNYPLNTGIILDGFNHSCNVWYCFHRNEDIESFIWVLNCYLGNESHGDTITPPKVFVSEQHQSVIASVRDLLPFTFHVYCLHHLEGNVDTNLRLLLGALWQDFNRDFWQAYRAVSPDQFEALWQHLVNQYPAAQEYLQGDLYES
ncbi:hypothetical protein D9758_015857 [Tetrapyrgos nigripes]|uniref:MULE transposase domain-containing protein n=1 Tax=Tetrapyrgos nigripes TaxID=182062 RepID=A0A8H5FGX7_9AGAR|nr:hypothetical protein D9758_015857 [Tetrapyrgos nigripes]